MNVVMHMYCVYMSVVIHAHNAHSLVPFLSSLPSLAAYLTLSLTSLTLFPSPIPIHVNPS